MAKMMRYVAKRKCFFQNRRYKKGMVLVTDISAEKIPSHFKGGKLLTKVDENIEKLSQEKEKKQKEFLGTTLAVKPEDLEEFLDEADEDIPEATDVKAKPKAASKTKKGSSEKPDDNEEAIELELGEAEA